MASPKDGTAGDLVPPAGPDEAKDADKADPGEVEKAKAAERVSKTGKYGIEPVTPYKKAPPGTSSKSEQKKSWIAIKVVDTDNYPVPGEPYEITLPDNSVASGTTDAKGMARVDGFDPGPCKVKFPKLDKTVIKPH